MVGEAYSNFVPIRVARNLGKPTQTFANLACVEISSPPTPKVAILTLKVSTIAIDVGQGQLKIDPKFASDGSQRTLSLRDPGQEKLHPEGLRQSRVF